MRVVRRGAAALSFLECILVVFAPACGGETQSTGFPVTDSGAPAMSAGPSMDARVDSIAEAGDRSIADARTDGSPDTDGACRCPSNSLCSPFSGCICQCPGGCCDGDGNCHPGSSNTQCGTNMCEDCTLSGGQCNDQSCTPAIEAGVCNVVTCPSGCCDESGLCEQGLTGFVCGKLGQSCDNCLAKDQICSHQQCISAAGAGPGCGPMTCNTGCCDAAGNCQSDISDTQCGTDGERCTDCTKLGGTCRGSCFLPDGGAPCSSTCSGCCDAAGNCQPGFADAECGDVGGACEDCSAQSPASTCDVHVSPRVCTSKSTQCPGPYAGCPAALKASAPARRHVCPALDLEGAAMACADGPNANACSNFFGTESTTNPSCFDCLNRLGVSSCVAPYVSAICNHNTACLDDCVAESCVGCLDEESLAQCTTEVQAGACSAYYTASDCLRQAVAGPASMCDDADYASWLRNLGAAYCAE